MKKDFRCSFYDNYSSNKEFEIRDQTNFKEVMPRNINFPNNSTKSANSEISPMFILKNSNNINTLFLKPFSLVLKGNSDQHSHYVSPKSASTSTQSTIADSIICATSSDSLQNSIGDVIQKNKPNLTLTSQQRTHGEFYEKRRVKNHHIIKVHQAANNRLQNSSKKLHNSTELCFISSPSSSSATSISSTSSKEHEDKRHHWRTANPVPYVDGGYLGRKASGASLTSDSTTNSEHNWECDERSLSKLIFFSRQRQREVKRINQQGSFVRLNKKGRTTIRTVKSAKTSEAKMRVSSLLIFVILRWIIATLFVLLFVIICLSLGYFAILIMVSNSDNNNNNNNDYHGTIQQINDENPLVELLRYANDNFQKLLHENYYVHQFSSTESPTKILNNDILISQNDQSDHNKLFSSPYDKIVRERFSENNETSRTLMKLVDAEKIRTNLRKIASNVHVSGTTEQLNLMDMLEEEYRNLGYEINVYEYDVLLSYPDYKNPNTIHKWNTIENDWTELSNGLAERLGDVNASAQQGDQRSLVWWNAYSANGNATSQIVYVNYGTHEDYNALNKMNISVSGKIVLARYGASFRGDKAYLAQQYGAIGLILYSDPYDFASDSSGAHKTFPEAIWLPPSGAQRGTLMRTVGDPETPHLPSKPYVHRTQSEKKLRKTKILPDIPVTSIGYRDAAKMFQNLDGISAPWSGWQGGLDVNYRISGNATFRLDVRSISKHKRIKNFTAALRGQEQPDKWVMLGNHADAWVKGAIDPGTGTATMLEIARVLTHFSESKNWRPRRTICFCQWDAEEFGLIGSTEWLEENIRFVENRAIAYINVDNINGNKTIQVKAAPLLYRTIVEAASKVGHPLYTDIDQSSEHKSLLDAWRFYSPKGPLPGDRTVPAIQLPDSGSDFQRFISYAGIPVADIRLESAPIYSYMLYHSMYEIPWTVETFIDPRLKSCAAVGQMWLEIGRNLADSLIIPFNVEDYGTMIGEFVQRMDIQLKHMNIDVALGEKFYHKKRNSLQEAIFNFQKEAVRLQLLIQEINAGHRLASFRQVEMINSRLQALERCFILDRGLYPELAFYRHAILSGDVNEPYSGAPLALIMNPAAEWFNLNNGGDGFEPEDSSDTLEDRKKYWLETIRNGFSNLQFSIESATIILKIDGV